MANHGGQSPGPFGSGGAPPGFSAPPGYHASGPPSSGPKPPSQPPSKVLPVVVAGGLAVGIFGGLVIMNGGKKRRAEAALDAGAPVAQVRPAPIDAAPAPPPPDAAIAIDAARPDASTALATSGPAIDAGSGAADDDAPDKRIPERATITLAIEPSGVTGLSVTVDGASVSGERATVELGGRAKRVRIVARARGYRSFSRTVTVKRDTTVRVELQRPKTDTAPGGLIDL